MWNDAFPNFLIGLREGLEAGLIVSILVATLTRAGRTERLGAVWTGVLAAIALSLSFGAVLTFAAADMPTKAQEAFGGVLSVVAVGFVTMMVFWMRRSARSLAGEIKSKVTAALDLGPGVLVGAAFLAVAREGLETSLFLWTTTRTARESAGPLIGAALGLVLAAALCWGLYRRVLKINLTRFFTVTGIVLIVIAAGVFGYGIRDLQDGGLLPGGQSYLVNLTGVNTGAWYARLIEGTLNLTAQMTVLQVVGYLLYLIPVLGLFVYGVRAAGRPTPTPTPPPASPPPAATPAATGAAVAASTPAAAEPAPEPATPAARRRPPRWAVATTVAVVPVLLAGAAILAFGPRDSSADTVVEVSASVCGKGWSAPKPGRQTLRLRNTGANTTEVYLLNPATGAVYGEVEGLAPGTTRPLGATFGAGEYALRCVPDGASPVTSASVRVGGGAGGGPAVVPVSAADLSRPVDSYRSYVAAALPDLAAKADALAAALHSGDLNAARTAWLPAHLAYERLGAAYGTFGEFDAKIDGRPDGLPGGVHDPAFHGFHRIEYGLWHGESAASLTGPADQLAADVRGLIAAFPKQETDPNDLGLRAHEILENTLRRQLTGEADQGSGTSLATALANLDGDRQVLAALRPLLATRYAAGLRSVDAWLDRVQNLLTTARTPDGGWTPVSQLDPMARQRLDGAMGELLENLAPIADILEVRKAS